MKPQHTSSTNSGSRIQRNSPRYTTQYTVSHTCGHEQVHDITGPTPGAAPAHRRPVRRTELYRLPGRSHRTARRLSWWSSAKACSTT